ncbi:NADPH-dependent F420 reductase [Promicromonospora sp. Marseille-Q5078]
MRIGILGTGALGSTLARGWASAGHEVVLAGRSRQKADEIAARLGSRASCASLSDAVREVDAVLLAISWTGVAEVLDAVGAARGNLAGTVVIDPTNPVEHGVGEHLLPAGSAAEAISSWAPGARVVKALNLHPAQTWSAPATGVTVPFATDDHGAARSAAELVGSLGATAHRIGGIGRARQLEELAGVVIALAAAGIDPQSVVPGFHRVTTRVPMVP